MTVGKIVASSLLSVGIFANLSCNSIRSGAEPIDGSETLAENWERVSIKEHPLILSPLKFAESHPEEYESHVMRAPAPIRTFEGVETLTVTGGEQFPKHVFALNRQAGTMKVTVWLDDFPQSPLESDFERKGDGWHLASARLDKD